MSTLYAKAAGGNWTAASTWSITGSGGADNAGPPTNADDAVFQVGSGNVTIDASTAVAKSVDFSAYVGTLTWASFVLTVSGNMTFGAGMALSGMNTSTQLLFNATATLTTAAKLMPSTCSISGGTLSLGDDYNGPASHFGIISMGNSGSINMNGHKILGNSVVNRILVAAGTTGSARSITGAVNTSFANCDFRDVQFTSATDLDFSAITGKSGDCLGNSITGGGTNLTFTTGVTNYVGAYATGSNVRMPGVAGFTIATPDSAALSIVGDLTLDAQLSLDDWTPAAAQSIIAKSGAVNTVSYIFFVNTTGTLVLSTSVLGTTLVTSSSTVATGFIDGSTHWVRATLQVNDGASHNVVKFYTSPDGSTWTQLGATITNTGATTIFDGSTVLEMGTNRSGTVNLLVGNFYTAKVYNSYLQASSGTPVFNADFTALSIGTNLFTESSSNHAFVAINSPSWTVSTAPWSTRVPLPQDDVKITNGFIAGRTITSDVSRLGRNVDFTGMTGNPTLNCSVGPQVFGSLTLNASMVSSGSGFSFLGRSSNHTITCAGISLAGTQSLQAPGGTYTLQDAFLTAGAFSHLNGTLVTQGFSCTSASLSSISTFARTLTLSTTTWTLTSTAVVTIINFLSAGLTLDATTATFVISVVSANTRTVALGAQNIGTLTYTVAGSTGELDITGGGGIVTINFSDVTNARSLKFTAGTTVTFTTFNVQGTATKLMTVASITGAAHTLVKASGTVLCDYLNVVNSHAGGGATWYAGSDSTDGGGNTGWIFATGVVLADTGSGSDVLTSLLYLQALADSGSGSDDMAVSSTFPVADTGSGTDQVAISNSLPLSDTGSGADTLLNTQLILLADSGSGLDTIAIENFLVLNDTGSGIDLITALLNTFSLADSGEGLDEVLVTQQYFLFDSGSGTDRLRLDKFGYSYYEDSVRSPYSPDVVRFSDRS